MPPMPRYDITGESRTSFGGADRVRHGQTESDLRGLVTAPGAAERASPAVREPQDPGAVLRQAFAQRGRLRRAGRR